MFSILLYIFSFNSLAPVYLLVKINNKKIENNGKCKLSAFLFYPILLNNYISSTIPTGYFRIGIIISGGRKSFTTQTRYPIKIRNLSSDFRMDLPYPRGISTYFQHLINVLVPESWEVLSGLFFNAHLFQEASQDCVTVNHTLFWFPL